MNNKTEKQLEQKKEYTAPQMNVVELTNQANLLSSSCIGSECYYDGEGG